MIGDSMRRRRRRPGAGGGRSRSARRRDGLRPGLIPLLGLGAVLLGGGGGYLYATQVMFPAPELATGEFEEIPDLRGLELGEARELLAERGLDVGSVDSIRHPEAPERRILGQSPLPGQLGLPGGSVELTVSLGPERRAVPDVSRLRGDRALTVLRTTGFEVTVDSIEAWVPQGRVVGTRPEAGAMVALPGEVTMTVSLGPPMVTMPNLLGLQEERAREVLDSLGLAVGEVETAFRFGFSQGEVLEQFPRADSLVARGAEVRLVIGRRGFFRDRDGEPEGR